LKRALAKKKMEDRFALMRPLVPIPLGHGDLVQIR